ncbi:MAG: TetR/AcrR family transcriptional regulator [Sulfuricurvum sp.]|jgi:AcrR family transcriptional regulator|uniref:TetR/AcrR family transcriptional regulator n=1 Tax=Sulfuricurvum sp. TaxID=2025608 RepID=UPI002601050B|nr:TetR/AcrR family transcriptional regulator [Sulfuricurvum sp.]MCK9374462.1 TetR/AcrR family transcriptional regulator [Sulfuricurvum sp.]
MKRVSEQTINAKKEDRKTSIMQTALKLFSTEGFYTTTMPVIAKKLGMSVGNFYNYFSSKDQLAKELMLYISSILGEKLREINLSDKSVREKIDMIVQMYFRIARERPELIEYFLRIFLSNREIFTKECTGMVCVSDFVTELMLFFDDGVQSGVLKDQDFFSALGLFMGYLGGMVFLNGEEVLPQPLSNYETVIAENIYNALRIQ